MARPMDEQRDLQAQATESLVIYEEDFEESTRDPRVKAFHEESWAEFKRFEAAGRIIY